MWRRSCSERDHPTQESIGGNIIARFSILLILYMSLDVVFVTSMCDDEHLRSHVFTHFFSSLSEHFCFNGILYFYHLPLPGSGPSTHLGTSPDRKVCGPSAVV